MRTVRYQTVDPLWRVARRMTLVGTILGWASAITLVWLEVPREILYASSVLFLIPLLRAVMRPRLPREWRHRNRRWR